MGFGVTELEQPYINSLQYLDCALLQKCFQMLPKISRFRVNGAFHLLTGIVIGSIFTHVCHVNLVYEPPVTAFPQVSGIGRRKQDAEDVARFDEKCRLALYTKGKPSKRCMMQHDSWKH